MFSPSTGDIAQICSNGTFYQIALNTTTEISNVTEESNVSTAPQETLNTTTEISNVTEESNVSTAPQETTDEQQTQEQLKSGSSPTAVVALAVMCGLLITVLVTVTFLVAVVLLWRRKQAKKNMKMKTNMSYKE